MSDWQILYRPIMEKSGLWSKKKSWSVAYKMWCKIFTGIWFNGLKHDNFNSYLQTSNKIHFSNNTNISFYKRHLTVFLTSFVYDLTWKFRTFCFNCLLLCATSCHPTTTLKIDQTFDIHVQQNCSFEYLKVLLQYTASELNNNTPLLSSNCSNKKIN
jgi:hypothetical protein